MAISYIPKILIYGLSFRDTSGDGVTIRNLFTSYPKDKLLFIAPKSYLDRTNDINNYKFYAIGSNEILWQKLLSYFKKNKLSVPYIRTRYMPQNNTTISRKFYKRCIVFVLKYIGLFYIFNKKILSNQLIDWLNEAKPDLIYTQSTSYNDMKMVLDISNLLNIKVIFHIMDGTIESMTPKGIFHSYWVKKNEKLFSILLKKSHIHFCISNLMKKHYEQKYNACFEVYHNTVDVNKWSQNQYNYLTNNTFVILYIGRIGWGNRKLIKLMCSAIEKINSLGYNIIFKISSSYYTKEDYKYLLRFKCVNFIGPTLSNDVPSLLHTANLLFLPLDFDSSRKKSWLSIPTKMVEYMASNVPIFIVAPKETALYEYAYKYKWAFIHDNNRLEDIVNKLIEIISNNDKRKEISSVALKLSRENHDISVISINFMNSIIKAYSE